MSLVRKEVAEGEARSSRGEGLSSMMIINNQ